jgi:predicted glycosyltransferase
LGNEVWFIRLHPRQMHEMATIKDLFTKENLLAKVNIIEATQDPLPQLLANAKLHVTHSSGTAIEATFFGLKTILLNEIGLVSFPELIAKNHAIYIDYKDEDFVSKFKSNLISLEKPEISPIFEQPIVSNLFP